MRLSTDKPIDKIVKYLEATIVIPGFGFTDVPIEHEFNAGLPYQARWSFSPTFEESFEETFTTSVNDVYVSFSNGAYSCMVRTQNNNSTARTIYVRILILARGGVSINSEATQSGLDAFNLNTDYNYPKLAFEFTLPPSGGSENHNLGHIPQADGYTIGSGGAFVRYGISNMTSLGLGSFESRLLIDENSVTYVCPTPLPSEQGIYVRVYEDSI